MKVVELINKLNEIGYDENTELIFGFVNGDTGEWYEAKFNDFFYGKALTGDEYKKDVIDIDINVDGCTEYISDKTTIRTNEVLDEIKDVLNKYYI